MASRCLLLVLAVPVFLSAQEKVVWTSEEKPIVEQLRKLRSLTVEERPIATEKLALEIRKLPAGAEHKARLANSLANLATEGDPGHATLQEVGTTLEQSLAEEPEAARQKDSSSYTTLAELVRYEHVQASTDNPQFMAAISKLDADDKRRENADFTLTDLHGKTWTLKGLRGKVVLLNFWATWCPPCRAEMPDLDRLYQEFKKRGLVILAISDEEAAKVKPFVAERKFHYPILLDPGRKVNEQLDIQGIPKSFLYDRDGKLVAQAMDMRTRSQFLEMLAGVGLK